MKMDEAGVGRILVVDDHADTRFLIVRILRSRGFDVVEADGGVAALDLIQASHFDLIVLDVMMPDVDGFEVCAHVKSSSITASIPVIFVTALDDSDTRSICLGLGAADVMVKPVNKDVLIRRVEAELVHARQQPAVAPEVASGVAGASEESASRAA